MGINEAKIGFNHWTSLLATNKDYVKSGGYKFLTEDLVIFINFIKNYHGN
jgi:hypothetical protein